MALPILRRGGSPVSVRRGDNTTSNDAMNRISPWNDLALMDRLFDNFFSSPLHTFGRGLGQMSQPAEPVVEIYETSDDLLAFLYAPGMAPGGFDIAATGDTVTIKGERKPLLENTEGVTSHTPWTALAIGEGAFSASYSLPAEIDPTRVEANYKDGVLQLRMPKSEAAKPKQVKVQVTAS